MAAERGRIEPAPRRVRGYFDNTLVFDTTRARYVWEAPYYPQYYIPVSDVRMENLLDEDHPQRVQLGPSRIHSLTSGGRTHKSAARVFDTDGDGPVAGHVRFEWDALDWFEEDEQIIAHPRNPYVRVDVLRSHRHTKIEIDGTVLAETQQSRTAFRDRDCPPGTTSTAPRSRSNISRKATPSRSVPTRASHRGYWSAHAGDTVRPDIAWTYEHPVIQVAPIAGLVAFYNEKLDIFVDGEELPRPSTHFT